MIYRLIPSYICPPSIKVHFEIAICNETHARSSSLRALKASAKTRPGALARLSSAITPGPGGVTLDQRKRGRGAPIAAIELLIDN